MTCHPETTILILKTGLPSATHLCYTPEKLAFLEDIAKKDGKSHLIL